MVSIFKMRRFSCLLRLPLPPEMSEIAQMLEIEWLAAFKCRNIRRHMVKSINMAKLYGKNGIEPVPLSP